MMTPFMKFRVLLGIILLIFVVITFFYVDYADMSIQNNRTEYLSITTGLLMAGIMLWNNKIEAKRNNRDKK
ncbi:MAG: hypothetical protein ACP5DQ_03645 [Bacteroidales bacterium]